MFVIIKTFEDLWTVGYFSTTEGWTPVSDHISHNTALNKADRLNR